MTSPDKTWHKPSYTVKDFIHDYGTSGFDAVFSRVIEGVHDEKLAECASAMLSDLRTMLQTEAHTP